MTKNTKTQSPRKPQKKAAAKATSRPAKKAAKAAKQAKKTARTKPAQSAQNQAETASSTQFSPEAFAALWQEKWEDMLREKGWPEQGAVPPVGQMPFFMPFMMPAMSGGMGGAMGAAPDPFAALLARMTALEHRIMELEKQVAQRNTKKAAKAKP